MSEMTPNAELAYAVLDQIDSHPELWDQGQWVGEMDCGTVACFAGWALLLSGCRIDRKRTFHEVVDGPDGLIGKGIPQAADILLGITVDYLNDRNLPDPYDGLHTRESLGEAVAEIFGPRPEPERCRTCRAEGFRLTDGLCDGCKAADSSWRECAHRADYTSSAHHERECAYHRGEVDADGLPVDDVPPNAGSAS